MSKKRNVRAKGWPDRGTDSTGRSKRDGYYAQLFHRLLDWLAEKAEDAA